MHWFDAHLDLACLAENGRDLALPLEACGGPWSPAAVSFPALADGDVRAFLGTIFIEADGDDAVAYPAGDAAAAHALGLRQLAWYQRWHAQGLIHLARRNRPSPASAAPACLILMECADPIREPAEVHFWADQGVACIGMAWARGSRYAAGNSEPSCSSPTGLTDLGRALVREIDRAGIVHDASHLSDRALAELLELTEAPIVATHSNARALLNTQSQRHLTDDSIREIARRGGVIGLNLFAPFLRAGLAEGERPTIADAVRHVEHICDLVGHRRAVGLGSDLDGGFSGLRLPIEISRPLDYAKLADALSARGWPDEDIAAFRWGNWARFWGLDPR